MIVAHVGPPTTRIGGPAGYLHQLKSAALVEPSSRHDVRFPETAPSTRPVRGSSSSSLSLLTRLQRKFIGPKFYRPPAAELTQRGGVIDRMLLKLAADLRADVQPSLVSALADADVVFTHDAFSAESALAGRRSGQQVWMMCHGVTPIGLYTAWSWAVPEADWHTLVDLADVRAWTDWELGVWKNVDGLVLPCAEAGESFRTIDSRFEEILEGGHYILSGASAPGATARNRQTSRARRSDSATGDGGDGQTGRHAPNRRVGLYLGSPEPYRGFDALIAAVQTLPAESNLTIAVAGPDPRKIPAHPAIRALGRVEDVGALLASVDFLINVNRFSLFDLSTIEAAEAGKPLMLHMAGGNRAFERLGAGCIMLRDLLPSTIADCLTRTAALDASSLAVLGEHSRRCWEEHLTPRHMWERHLALYDELAGT
jgi:hypothetical protein